MYQLNESLMILLIQLTLRLPMSNLLQHVTLVEDENQPEISPSVVEAGSSFELLRPNISK